MNKQNNISEGIAALLGVYMLGLAVWTAIYAFTAKGILAAVISSFFFMISPIYWIFYHHTATQTIISPYTIFALLFYPFALTFMLFRKS